MGATEIDGVRFREMVERSEGGSNAIGIGNAQRSKRSLDRTLIVGHSSPEGRGVAPLVGGAEGERKVLFLFPRVAKKSSMRGLKSSK